MGLYQEWSNKEKVGLYMWEAVAYRWRNTVFYLIGDTVKSEVLQISNG